MTERGVWEKKSFLGLFAFVLFIIDAALLINTVQSFNSKIRVEKDQMDLHSKQQVSKLLEQANLKTGTRVTLHIIAENARLRKIVKEKWQNELLQKGGDILLVTNAFSNTEEDRIIESFRKRVSSNRLRLDPSTMPEIEGRKTTSFLIVIYVNVYHDIGRSYFTVNPTLIHYSGDLLAKAGQKEIAFYQELKTEYKLVLSLLLAAGGGLFLYWLILAGFRADFVISSKLDHAAYWLLLALLAGVLLGLIWWSLFQPLIWGLFFFPILMIIGLLVFLKKLPGIETDLSPLLQFNRLTRKTGQMDPREIMNELESVPRFGLSAQSQKTLRGLLHELAEKLLSEQIPEKQLQELDLEKQLQALEQLNQTYNTFHHLLMALSLAGREHTGLSLIEQKLAGFRSIINNDLDKLDFSDFKTPDDRNRIFNRLETLKIDTTPIRKRLARKRWQIVKQNLPENVQPRMTMLLKEAEGEAGESQELKEELSTLLKSHGIHRQHFRIRFRTKNIRFSFIHVLFGSEQNIGRKHIQGGNNRIFTADMSVSRNQGVISWNNNKLWISPNPQSKTKSRLNGELLKDGVSNEMNDRSILCLSPTSCYEICKCRSWNLRWKEPERSVDLPIDYDKYSHIQFSLFCCGENNGDCGLRLSAETNSDIILPEAVSPFQAVIQEDKDGFLRLYSTDNSASYNGCDPVSLTAGLPVMDGCRIEFASVEMEVSLLS